MSHPARLPKPFNIDEHVKEFGKYREAWHDKQSPLYHAPKHILELLKKGKIDETTIAANTRYLFRDIKRFAERGWKGKFGQSDLDQLMSRMQRGLYNPNIHRERIGTGLLPHQHMLYYLIKGEGGDLVTQAIKNGWDHTALDGNEDGLPGLFGYAATKCNNGALQALKAYSDARGGCMNIHASSADRYPPDESELPKWGDYHFNVAQWENSLFDAVLSSRFDNAASLLKWGVDPYAWTETPYKEPETLANILLHKLPDSSASEREKMSAARKFALAKLMRQLARMGAFRFEYEGEMSSNDPPQQMTSYSPADEEIKTHDVICRENIEREILHKQAPQPMQSLYVLIKHVIDVEEQLYKPIKEIADNPSSKAFDLDILTAEDIIKLYSISRLDALLTPDLWHGREAQLIALIHEVPHHVQNVIYEHAPALTAMNARTTVQGPAKDWSAVQAPAPESEVHR